MKILKAAENYLETILMIRNGNGKVRSIDIARYLKYSKPTVSIAMKQLRESGHIIIDDEGYIELTKNGSNIAEKIYERHMVIANILMAMGVDEKTALEDSCKIEHEISDKSFECMKKYSAKINGFHI